MESLSEPRLRDPRTPVCGSLSVTVLTRDRKIMASVIDISEKGLGLLFHEGEDINAGDFIKVSGKEAMVRWALPVHGGLASGVRLL